MGIMWACLCWSSGDISSHQKCNKKIKFLNLQCRHALLFVPPWQLSLLGEKWRLDLRETGGNLAQSGAAILHYPEFTIFMVALSVNSVCNSLSQVCTILHLIDTSVLIFQAVGWGWIGRIESSASSMTPTLQLL